MRQAGQSEKELGSRERREIDALMEMLKIVSFLHKPMQQCISDRYQLSENELRVLFSLAGEGVLAGQEISSLIGMPPMNVSRALGELERNGLVERASNKTNRRRKPFRLSKAGSAIFDRMQGDLSQVCSLMFKGLKAADTKALLGQLATVRENLEAYVRE